MNDINNDDFDFSIYYDRLDSKTSLLIEKLSNNDHSNHFIDESIQISNIMDKFSFNLMIEDYNIDKMDIQNDSSFNNPPIHIDTNIMDDDINDDDDDSFFFYDQHDEIIKHQNEFISSSDEIDDKSDKMDIEIDNEPLDNDEKQKIDDLIDKLLLFNDDDQDIMSSQIQLTYNDISILNETKKLKQCLELLNLSLLNDSTLFKLCHLFITESLSFIKSILFFHYSLKIKLEQLKSQASRTLIQCFIHCFKKQPVAMIEGVFIPIIISNNLDINQSEAIHRVLKSIIEEESMETDHLNHFFELILMNNNSSTSFHWNEPLIDLFHKIISLKVLLSNEIIHSLIKNIEIQLDHINISKKSSLKTSTLLFNIINKYEKVISDDLNTIRRIANRIDNYMAKKVLKRIE